MFVNDFEMIGTKGEGGCDCYTKWGSVGGRRPYLEELMDGRCLCGSVYCFTVLLL